MGVCRFAEDLYYELTDEEVPQSISNIIIIWNTLQAVIIFLIFVCNKRVLKLLYKNVCRGNQSFITDSEPESINYINYTNIRNDDRLEIIPSREWMLITRARDL